MTQKNSKNIHNIQPHQNTMVPPHSCPTVLTSPAHGKEWEGSPFSALKGQKKD